MKRIHSICFYECDIGNEEKEYVSEIETEIMASFTDRHVNVVAEAAIIVSDNLDSRTLMAWVIFDWKDKLAFHSVSWTSENEEGWEPATHADIEALVSADYSVSTRGNRENDNIWDVLKARHLKC
ncbi:MAG: hypothetical protein OEV92_02545 [Nitrospinota bacterium]|nr:hypothetical protein [Nitrospinota bacterium]